MIGVDFLWPLLLAAPLAALSVAWGLRTAAGIDPARRALTIALRTIALALLAATAAVPHARVDSADMIETVFLVDVSESVTDPMLQQAADWIEAHDGRAAVVAFAGRPALVSPMGPPPHRLDRSKLLHRRALKEARAALAEDPEAESRVHSIEAWRSTIDPWSTDLGRALEAAQILFERANDRRRVLFTDGRALELPPPDRFRGVQTIRLRDPSPDLVVHSLAAPLSIRPGEPFDAKLDLTSRGLRSARLQVAFDGVFQQEMDRDVALVEGRQIVLLRNLRPPPDLAGGLHSFSVLARAEGETEPRNNSADTFLRLVGRPRFLLLREPGARDEALATLLGSLGAEVTVDRAAALAGISAELASFDAVVAVGPPAPDVPTEAWRTLSRYVSEMGGGLLFLADPGMMAEPPPAELAALLPIEFQLENPAPGPQPAAARKPVPQEVRAPVAAIIFVIDKSGSMAGMNLALAKEACIASAKTLSPRDIVGVVAFDRQAYWVVPPTQADRIATIESQILRLHAYGSTNIYAGLQAARAGFRGIQAGIKHLILLSDGETIPADFDPLVRGMVEEGITLTTVTLLEGDFDLAMMGWLAQAGKGRSLWAKDPKALPQIFTHEVRHILRTLERPVSAPPAAPEPSPKTASGEGLGRKEIQLQAAAPHETTRGIPVEEAPALGGMIAGEARPTAIVPLVEPAQGRPLFAVWRVGLGKVGAWSADFGGEWSNEFVSWPGSGKLMSQILRYLSSTLRESPLAANAQIRVDGQRAAILVDLPVGAPLTGQLTHPIRAPLDFAKDETGVWRAEFRLAQVGQVYQATLTSGEETALLAATAAYSEELALPEPLPRAFHELAQAGGWVTEIGDAPPPWPKPPPRRERMELGPWTALAALLLLAIDLAIRRL